ncbi:response regulator [Niabella defluvii]|nr:response regulator [Niabella sp. I65]
MSKVILIVEDEPDLMEVICLILALDEYVLVPCATVRAFKQELEKQFPDLIILDVRLPDGNGIDICNEMKGHNDFKSDTYYANVGSFRFKKLSKNCADVFIEKPFSIDDFRTRVRMLLAG